MAFTPEGFLKGRMAESLVEELLKNCGNRVYRFGYEAILQNLTQLEKAFDRDSEVGQRIRSIPDFIVIDKKGEPFLVEVKFRTNFVVYSKDVPRVELVEKFWKPKILFITLKKPYFRVSNSPYLNEKRDWNWIPLEDDKDLKIDGDILREFDKLVERYFIVGKNEE